MPTDPFEQYPFLIEDTARLSDRRQTVNNIYLSVNSVLLGGLALLVQVSGLRSFSLAVIAVMIAAAGFVITHDWRKLVLNYRTLLALRFTLLREIESLPDFPFPIKTFEREDALFANPSTKRGKQFGFSDIEERLTHVFKVLYLLSAVLIVVFVVLLRYGIIAHLLRDGIIPPFLVPPQ